MDLGDSEVKESNGLDLFLTRVPEDAWVFKGFQAAEPVELGGGVRCLHFFLKLKLRHPNNLFEDFEDWKSMERQYF